jgi:hypothetical protein
MVIEISESTAHVSLEALEQEMKEVENLVEETDDSEERVISRLNRAKTMYESAHSELSSKTE